jgi:hypothetical protein
MYWDGNVHLLMKRGGNIGWNKFLVILRFFEESI